MKQKRNLLYPPQDFIFDTYTEIQASFIKTVKTQGIDAATEWFRPIKDLEIEYTYQRPLSFSWDGEAGDVFELSKNKEFSECYRVVCEKPSCEVENLEVGQEYFWRVNGGESFRFFTKDNEIRFIRIDGTYNVRDLGGKNIRQGLLYRGADMDLVYPLTDEGKRTFCGELNIKTEIDLRGGLDPNRPSGGGENVRFICLPYRAYCEAFFEEHKRGVCKIMEFLSDESNYPIYFHCLAGADRTGAIAFYLRALAGDREELIHLDYELTGLSNSYTYDLKEQNVVQDEFRRRTSPYYQEFLKELETYAPNEPISAQVRAFLLDCGVTQETLDKIISIIKKS